MFTGGKVEQRRGVMKAILDRDNPTRTMVAIHPRLPMSRRDQAAASLEDRLGLPRAQFVRFGRDLVRYRDEPASAIGQAPTVVMLHGGNLSLESWDGLSERLGGRARRIAVDLPGHGLTGATTERNYSVPGMVTFIEAFTRAIGLDHSFALIGHSMGGHLAWRYAIAHPGRVARLVLIAPGGIAAPEGPQGRAFRLAATLRGRLLLRAFNSRKKLEAGLREVFCDKAQVTTEMVNRMWAMGQRLGVRAASISRLRTPSFEPSMIARLSEIKVPVLLLWGEDDRVFPLDLSQAFINAIPSARLIPFERCGHFPMMEAADRSGTEILNFLGLAG
jgi:pimeloyl-ACP methyl ester carboxylesterase